MYWLLFLPSCYFSLTQESHSENKVDNEKTLYLLQILLLNHLKENEGPLEDRIIINNNRPSNHNNHQYSQRGDPGEGRSNWGGWGGRNKPHCQICTLSSNILLIISFFDMFHNSTHQVLLKTLLLWYILICLVIRKCLSPSLTWTWIVIVTLIRELQIISPMVWITYLLELSMVEEIRYNAANGLGLPIHHHGSLSFNSSIVPSKSLVINNILHVPLITINLISVSRFVENNNVFVDFHLLLFFLLCKGSSY